MTITADSANAFGGYTNIALYSKTSNSQTGTEPTEYALTHAVRQTYCASYARSIGLPVLVLPVPVLPVPDPSWCLILTHLYAQSASHRILS